MNLTLQVLVEMKRVLKEELRISKTTVLPKGVSQQSVFDETQSIINTKTTLTHRSVDILLAFF